MPDGMGGAGIGAGGGAAAAGLALIIDKLFGSGRAVKSIDTQFQELGQKIEDELNKIVEKATSTAELVSKLVDWHAVSDPDDPAGKIWYFSVGLRSCMKSLEARTAKLLDLLEELVRRFDRYNETLAKLVTVTEKLDKNVSALGVMVAADRRGR
jgi:hypothetical protein